MTFLWPTSQMGMLHPTAETREARDRAKEFRRMARYSRQNMSYATMKGKFAGLSSSAVETRVAAFAETGLLYGCGPTVPIVLTPVGEQLFSLVEPNSALGPAESRQATALLTWALSNCQIDRARSPGSPRLTEADRTACDVRPYLTAWSLMLDLDGTLYMHEFLGPVRKLQKLADYDACVAQVRAARASGTTFPNPQSGSAGTLANASIYWRSRLSVAGQLLHFDAARQRLVFAPGGESIVEAVLEAHGANETNGPAAIAARKWTTLEDYFAFAGASCTAEVTGAVIDALAAPAEPPPPVPSGAPPAPAPPIPGGNASAEGRRRYRLQSQIERRSWMSREAKRLNALQHGGNVTCEACGFGHQDTAMMDAHHERPLAGGVRDTRLEDLRILCPTCHRRAHRSEDRLQPYSIAHLQEWVTNGRP